MKVSLDSTSTEAKEMQTAKIIEFPKKRIVRKNATVIDRNADISKRIRKLLEIALRLMDALE